MEFSLIPVLDLSPEILGKYSVGISVEKLFVNSNVFRSDFISNSGYMFPEKNLFMLN